MWHADQIGVQADRHDPPGGGALGIERIELPADHFLELVDRAVSILEMRRVVDFVRVRDRHQPIPADIHEIGLVVIDPVSDVKTAFCRKEIEGVPSLGETGAEPTDRLLAGHLGDARESVRNRLSLLAGSELVEPYAVGAVVAKDLPAELHRRPHNLWVMVADVAVEGRAGADAVLAEHIHQPPDADAIAVVALRPGAHRGRVADGRAGIRGDAAAEWEEFDIGDNPECDPGAAGPFELWPILDRNIRKRAVVARFHGTASIHRLSFADDQHAKDRDGMAALRGTVGSRAVRDAALPPEHLCRRAALALSRPRWPRPERVAFAAASRRRDLGLPSPHHEAGTAAAAQHRQSSPDPAAAPSRPRPEIDQQGTAVLSGALSGTSAHPRRPAPARSVL